MNERLIITQKEVYFAGHVYPVAIGRGGMLRNKKEGDGATPIGLFPIRRVFYRADRIKRPITALPLVEIKDNDGWCNDVSHKDYNTLVKLPHMGSHELLYRDDELYDLIVELGYNDSPPINGKGSAIFMHVARPDYSPTAGCIALKKEDLLELLSLITMTTTVEISQFSLFETYRTVILGSLGSHLFRHSYINNNQGGIEDILVDGELSCAFFVSSLLKMFNLINFQHATVLGAVKDLKEFGWTEISEPRIGAILVWEQSKEVGAGEHSHIGFYVGDEMAISNSKSARTPTKHHYLHGMSTLGPLREILWHPRLGLTGQPEVNRATLL